MTDHPKTLILTTNRTEDGAPVYAPCGDLRAALRELNDLQHRMAIELDQIPQQPRIEFWTRKMEQVICDALELSPSGDLVVARPLQIGVEYPHA